MLVFDSWDETYKKPFGAVETDRPVAFHIVLPDTLPVSGVKLRVTPDGSTPLLVDMQKLDGEKGCCRFTCTYALARPGLYWYDFMLETPEGESYIVFDRDGLGKISGNEGDQWQLTVYDTGFSTPDWLKGGVLYQIMPDRFAREGDLPGDLPEGRYLRADWGGTPEFRGDEEGKYLNNTYFGGNLKGITSKLPYLKFLGVTAIYLNPVFEAHSNHRYNTADYMKIDPMLGTEEDFRELCQKAKELGIRIILDGVFSHTGDDSRYFNRQGRYPETGAYQSQASPYSSWYRFKSWPDEYDCWWGYKTLPEVNETDESYLEFITGPDGVLEHWIKAGASGFRLDVADELPSAFIQALRKKVKELNGDAVIIGEVWEDASCKISYGERRPYLNGRELDSVMNYPFRNAILRFLKGSGAEAFGSEIITILEHYPKPCTDVLMNIVGTHDTPRILTSLAGEPGDGHDRAWKAEKILDPEQRKNGLRMLRLAAVLQFFLPGVPCVYYGDEAGMEGYDDPFNRRCYQWGKEDRELLFFYRRLGEMRGECPTLRSGGFRILTAQGSLFVFERYTQNGGLICSINAGERIESFSLPENYSLLDGACVMQKDGAALSPGSYAVFLK